MKKYADCQLKAAILSTLAQSEQGRTSRELFDAVGHKSWDAFRVEVYQLWRRGRYLTRTKIDGKRECRYSLSKLGHVHAQNPYISIIKRRESAAAKVHALLTDDDSFKAAVQSEVNNRIGKGGSVSGGHGGPISTPSASVNDSKVIEEMRKKDDRIAELETKLQAIKIKSQSATSTRPGQPAQKREKSPEQIKQIREEKARIKRRKALAQAHYSRGLPIDGRFLAEWNRGGGDIGVFKFKYKTWWSKNSLEVMSKSNPEFRRKHVNQYPLPAPALVQANIRIVKLDQSGITVQAHSLQDGKGRLRY